VRRLDELAIISTATTKIAMNNQVIDTLLNANPGLAM
jgi:hypothetical protein